MSNTDWYAAIEKLKPWKAFNEYARAVTKTIATVERGQRERSAPSGGQGPEPMRANVLALNLDHLGSVAAEAQSLWSALPPAAREPSVRCAGLPRAYPKMWMKRERSNSLMFEWREMQKLPSNKLKSWKD